MDKAKLIKFVNPYYAKKDVMHNMWHIKLVEKWVNKILALGCYEVNIEHLVLATYFHGFVYSHENEIRVWLAEQKLSTSEIDRIITIAYESQRSEAPKSIEGKILHDAHLVEGGKTYIVTKCLITGSVRGQSLLETISYIKENVLDKSTCYLPETIELLNEANLFAKEFIVELENGIGVL